MSITPLSDMSESDYGDELWFGGDGCGLISVGDWSAGGVKKDYPDDWELLQKQAKLISAAQVMFDALESVKAWMSTQDADQSGIDAWVKINKALASARGTS